MRTLVTKNGRDFYEVSSLLQKALRRGDPVMASRAASELLPRYASYTWNRLMTVSAEDCHDLVTAEVVALYDAYMLIAKAKRDAGKGRIYFAKAIVLLAKCRHSRDADELLILVADRMPDDLFDAAVAQCEAALVADEHFTIPTYVYDVHTRRGKRMGRTRQQFLTDEHEALRAGSTIFANFDEMAASDGWVQPELPWA